MESFGHVALVSLPCFQLLNCTETATEIKPAPASFSTLERGICPKCAVAVPAAGMVVLWLQIGKGRGGLGKAIDAFS